MYVHTSISSDQLHIFALMHLDFGQNAVAFWQIEWLDLVLDEVVVLLAFAYQGIQECLASSLLKELVRRTEEVKLFD